MGKKSREKARRKKENIPGKQLKDLRRNSKPIIENGQIFNPLKKITQAEIYKSETGNDILGSELSRYGSYLKSLEGEKKDER